MSNIRNHSTQVDPNVKARDIRDLASRTSNIYESITVISKRARQLSVELKRKLHEKLEEFVVVTETIEEIHENKEQIEISRSYERMASPTLLATEEFVAGDLEFRYPEPVEPEEDFPEDLE